jgi:hypothetical protein
VEVTKAHATLGDKSEVSMYEWLPLVSLSVIDSELKKSALFCRGIFLERIFSCKEAFSTLDYQP